VSGRGAGLLAQSTSRLLVADHVQLTADGVLSRAQ
jgi:hypothetical protein